MAFFLINTSVLVSLLALSCTMIFAGKLIVNSVVSDYHVYEGVSVNGQNSSPNMNVNVNVNVVVSRAQAKASMPASYIQNHITISNIYF